MSALAVLMIAIGPADKLRRTTRRTRRPVVIVPTAVVACALLAGL